MSETRVSAMSPSLSNEAAECQSNSAGEVTPSTGSPLRPLAPPHRDSIQVYMYAILLFISSARERRDAAPRPDPRCAVSTAPTSPCATHRPPWHLLPGMRAGRRG